MTMIPIYKKCSRCKMIYSWNPDVGKIMCPFCGKPGGFEDKDVNIDSADFLGLFKNIMSLKRKKN